MSILIVQSAPRKQIRKQQSVSRTNSIRTLSHHSIFSIDYCIKQKNNNTYPRPAMESMRTVKTMASAHNIQCSKHFNISEPAKHWTASTNPKLGNPTTAATES
ncbi:hypothetical protein Nepgr_013490 [Nepenthes gracilis]|uniref:Uncharacterized protein n=1 Tax=Nepenthes gracilis TaxID=150966 RepID=A0AAD3SJ10_NEPGR|nr:hypothetical protein Nepgr_013490 [Nepenthes gracilis]